MTMNATFFLDSNVIVKYYITEPYSAWVRTLITSPDHSFIISELSIAEVAAALSQLRRDKKISRKAMEQSYARFLFDIKQGLFFPRPIDFETLTRAAEIALTHAIKGADAIQVASAALSEDAIAVELTFVSNDRQALRVAQLEALEVDNPSDHPETTEIR